MWPFLSTRFPGFLPTSKSQCLTTALPVSLAHGLDSSIRLQKEACCLLFPKWSERDCQEHSSLLTLSVFVVAFI